MRENRPSGSEGGAGANPLFLPLSSNRAVMEVNLMSIFMRCFRTVSCKQSVRVGESGG
jgi:hypothetical protein